VVQLDRSAEISCIADEKSNLGHTKCQRQMYCAFSRVSSRPTPFLSAAPSTRINLARSACCVAGRNTVSESTTSRICEASLGSAAMLAENNIHRLLQSSDAAFQKNLPSNKSWCASVLFGCRAANCTLVRYPQLCLKTYQQIVVRRSPLNPEMSVNFRSNVRPRGARCS